MELWNGGIGIRDAGSVMRDEGRGMRDEEKQASAQ